MKGVQLFSAYFTLYSESWFTRVLRLLQTRCKVQSLWSRMGRSAKVYQPCQPGAQRAQQREERPPAVPRGCGECPRCCKGTREAKGPHTRTSTSPRTPKVGVRGSPIARNHEAWPPLNMLLYCTRHRERIVQLRNEYQKWMRSPFLGDEDL